MRNREGDTLYQRIRLDFFSRVYRGEIEPGQPLPAERKQAEELSVSRGTIRKARKMLEEEGFIANTQGSAAVYTPLTGGGRGKSEIVAAVVPVHNPFFMSYYRAFEREAEKEDILVMIKQLDHSNAGRLEKVLFSLFLKGIRDIVLWPYDIRPAYEYIERLSGLGMNMILFDTVRDAPFCDYISVDNRHAVKSLYDCLKQRDCTAVTYIGWDTGSLTSNSEREAVFRDLCDADDGIIRLPWNQELLTSRQLMENPLIRDLLETDGNRGILCGNGKIGITLEQLLIQRGRDDLQLVSMDNFEESEALGMTVYEQPFERMGAKTFEILSRRHRGKDMPGKHYIEGRLVER